MAISAIEREFGALLRTYRERSGETLTGLATRIGWPLPKMSKVETGNLRVKEIEVVHYLANCGARYDEVLECLEIGKQAVDNRGYWMSHSLRSLIFHESTAQSLTCYNPEDLPGLLQIGDYVRALLSPEKLAEDRLEARVESRLQRRALLFKVRPPKLTFFIHERALNLQVGGPEVMVEQLLSLVLLSDERRISVRIVPESAGQHAIFGGHFVFYRFAKHRPLVYLDSQVTGFFVEDKEYVARYQALVERIAAVSLGPEESRLVVADAAWNFDRAGIDVGRVAQEQRQQRVGERLRRGADAADGDRGP